MILDGHIHMNDVDDFDPLIGQKQLLASMNKAGIDGGVVLSLNPNIYGEKYTSKERIEKVMSLTDATDNLYPFYWIDPTQDDAIEQINAAVNANISGFKIICGDFYPSDLRAMKTYKHIAKNNKPLLFHSGILWDGKPSSKYNKPAEFECLLDIPNLRFTLAHMSWPWCDECIAVYGKFNNALTTGRDISCEMFIDTTPGTPAIWREEVFKKLFMGDYNVIHNVIFGSDCNTESYNYQWSQEWIKRDKDIFTKFELDKTDGFIDHIYYKNLLRFLGESDEVIKRKVPQIAT